MQGNSSKSQVFHILHDIVKMINSSVPRFDEIAKNALSSLFRQLKLNVPEKETLSLITSGHQFVSNTLVTKVVGGTGDEENILLEGALMGLTAGIATVGLGEKYGVQGNQQQKSPTEKVMTVACYILGGIVAAAVAKRIEERRQAV